ncbi:MAG: hypothetical protein HY234_15670 [Acidobacteria bacterium]|nr:hypothetical protein [Acidobacteriota bacterium]
MSHHQTKATESVTAYCNRCGKRTQHAVSDGRQGRCTEHEAPDLTKRQIEKRLRRQREAENPRLF